ncbi:MAG: magnesium transporter [Myxococcota bacterium]
MRLANLLGPDLKDTLASDPKALQEAIDEFHPEDVAEIIEEIPLEDAVALIRFLPDDMSSDVLERLSTDRQADVLSAIGSRESIPILSGMAPDDRVDLLQDLTGQFALELMDQLEKEDPEAAEEVRELQAYDEETAGGLMTTHYVSVAPDTKVWKVMEEIRRASREDVAETIDYVYVTAYGDQLVGVASLRDLILAEPANQVADVMVEKVVRVSPEEDQEHVAATINKYDLSAIPVVNERGMMLGVVTIDDMVDVVIEEATEDAQKMGGVVPLEDSYFDTGFGEFIWKRALWLIILFGGQLLTATVMEAHESEMAAMLGLVVFIPLIIATGGNSGAQSSTLVIRAMAVGEMSPGDWWRVAGRELFIGVSIGIVLGLVGFARAWFVGETASMELAITVGTSIVAVVTMGTLMGSLLPLGIKRVGLDPAVSSTPFIASLVDVLGLVVYFGIAQWILTTALS